MLAVQPHVRAEFGSCHATSVVNRPRRTPAEATLPPTSNRRCSACVAAAALANPDPPPPLSPPDFAPSRCFGFVPLSLVSPRRHSNRIPAARSPHVALVVSRPLLWTVARRRDKREVQLRGSDGGGWRGRESVWRWESWVVTPSVAPSCSAVACDRSPLVCCPAMSARLRFMLRRAFRGQLDTLTRWREARSPLERPAA